MKNVSLIRYSPPDSDDRLTAQLVECYRDVFADGPWHEWLKCPACQKYWGIRDRDILAAQKFRHCDTPLVDFWPRAQVVSDLYHEITPETSCWLALDDNLVIGFCWGYPTTINELEKKLGLSLGSKAACSDPGVIAYQDEVGVIPAYRKNKIAKTMVARRLEDFLAQGLRLGIVRTRRSPEPSETFLWYTEKLGYKIIVEYPDDDGRVILGRDLFGLKELLVL